MLTNSQMQPNRYLKWANARKLFAAIQAHMARGGKVMVATGNN